MERPSNPQRILVICIRRIGDVLLSTALIRSLRRQWPDAQIDVLVNAGSAVALEGNPDIHQLVVQPEKVRLQDFLRLAWRIFRRYDLSVCTLYNDRPQIYSLLAAPLRASVVPHLNAPGARWKRFISRYQAPLMLGDVHALRQYLAIADALGIKKVPEVIPPSPASTERLSTLLGADWQRKPYAVLHPAPMYRYKAWTVTGWRQLATALQIRGLTVCFTGGPGEAEKNLCAEIMKDLPERTAVNLAGALRFSELTPLIRHAQLFVGPDTSVTHLAAATGTPVVTLFGPSHPVAWGPWPCGHDPDSNPWQKTQALQQQGNVTLIQGIRSCVPCLNEGCEKRLDSHSACLDELPASRVIPVADRILARAHTA